MTSDVRNNVNNGELRNKVNNREVGAGAKHVSDRCHLVYALAISFAVLAAACPPEEPKFEPKLEPKIEPCWTCNSTLDLAPLTLHDNYCLAFRVPLDVSVVAWNIMPDGRLATFEVLDSKPWNAEIAAYHLDLHNGLFDRELLFTAHAEQASELIYPGAYLAVSAHGQVAVGYTQFDYFGQIMIGPQAAGVLAIDAPGNYSAASWQGDTLLVSGLGVHTRIASDNGIYAVDFAGPRLSMPPAPVISNLGPWSGPVAAGGDLVVAGGFTRQNELYAFTSDELAAAQANGFTLDADTDGDPVFQGALGGLWVTAQGAAINTLEATAWPPVWQGLIFYPMTVSGDHVLIDSPLDLVKPGMDGSTDDTAVIGLGGTADILIVQLKGPAGMELAGIIPGILSNTD